MVVTWVGFSKSYYWLLFNSSCHQRGKPFVLFPGNPVLLETAARWEFVRNATCRACLNEIPELEPNSWCLHRSSSLGTTILSYGAWLVLPKNLSPPETLRPFYWFCFQVLWLTSWTQTFSKRSIDIPTRCLQITWTKPTCFHLIACSYYHSYLTLLTGVNDITSSSKLKSAHHF